MKGNFLKVVYDIYQPKREKRCHDEGLAAELMPFIQKVMERVRETPADNPHNVAMRAYDLWKKAKN